MEVVNRFKGLDLIECLKKYEWRFMPLYRRQGSRPSPRELLENGRGIGWGDHFLSHKFIKRSFEC